MDQFSSDQVDQFSIDKYTGTLAATVGVANPFRYRGYYYDVETGFYYLNSRYYDPTLGRFLNADGYVSTGQGMLGVNMFAYCHNKPVLFNDPSGCKIEIIKGNDPRENEKNQEILNASLEYLQGSSRGAAIVEYAMNHEETVWINFSTVVAITYQSPSKTIYWDPERALKIAEGIIMSPAVGLGHELYHFWQHMELGATEETWDWVLVEALALAKFENPVCKALGEPVRENYMDFTGMVSVNSPTSFSNPNPYYAFASGNSIMNDAYLQVRSFVDSAIANLYFY